VGLEGLRFWKSLGLVGLGYGRARAEGPRIWKDLRIKVWKGLESGRA